jgi:hypothetical protein
VKLPGAPFLLACTPLLLALAIAIRTLAVAPHLPRYFFTSGHSLASSGLAASSGEIFAIIL